MTASQYKEIIDFLIAKKIPIDIILELKDHFVMQICETMTAQNLSFAQAFEQTQMAWKEDLEAAYPWYVIVRNERSVQTRIEKKMRADANQKVMIFALKITVFSFIFLILGTQWFSLEIYQKLLKGLLFLFLSVHFFFVMYFFIFNRILFKEKFKDVRFSIYQWKTFSFFPFAYLGLQFLSPWEEWVSPLYFLNFSLINTTVKIIAYVGICWMIIYANTMLFHFLKTMHLLKRKINFL